MRASGDNSLPHDPLWYRSAVIYQLHVRSFYDSNGDGIGDFPGLTQRLDYLQDLGVTAVWLLPFYPSPLKDDGYDIADYTGVNPAYGTLRDVKRFIAAAHDRGIRVITELVINHTSDQHPWFQRARRAPRGSRHRDFYVWSDDPTRYAGTRIIFQDFEPSNWAWDPVARQYYWHRFYSHQPDLNFDNPAVHRALEAVVSHWMNLGIDGVRLDAIPYLYEREGTGCENLPETHAYLKKLRAFIEARWPATMLLAEANQWPEDAVTYFGDGDECHMAFHFPLMPRLFMSIQMEDRFPIVDILQQTPPIPPGCQWAIFLRNHDELTLEMVTDEERDYMYRVYAQDRQSRINLGIRRRLAPLMGNNRRKMELMKGLLLSLPGTPVMYYGDEIGMGDNVYLGDRNGVRTPMQWSADRNAGFSRANPQGLFLPPIIDPEYHYEKINVEAQQANPSSMLWWMKRLVALRKRYPVLATGSLEMLAPSNPRVLAFIRRDAEQTVLVVANLSRFVQPAEIDLSAHRGSRPVELFGGSAFPQVGDHPYFLTLGPHSFYWFALEPGREPAAAAAPERRLRTVVLRESAERVMGSARSMRALEGVLAEDAVTRRWFRSKARRARSMRIIDAAPLRLGESGAGAAAVSVALARVEYTEGEAETYVMVLALATEARAAPVLAQDPGAAIAHARCPGEAEPRVLYDALSDPECGAALFDLMARRRRLRTEGGEVAGWPTALLRRAAAATAGGDGTAGAGGLEVAPARAEQSNSSIVFGQRYIMKLFRRVEAGPNPDLEVGRYLSERVGFPHTPGLAGAIEYHAPGAEPATLAMLQEYVPNQGDAWCYTLDRLGQYYEGVLATEAAAVEGAAPTPWTAAPPGAGAATLLAPGFGTVDEAAVASFGAYAHTARLLGQRTAEMHAALASRSDDPAFRPEPITPLYQRSMYQSMRNSARRGLALFRRRAADLPEALRPDLERLLAREADLLARLHAVTSRPFRLQRIRIHGDYHLGQVLFTGKDFVIIDFEGEPTRALGERRLKRVSLRDVAGMLRSFQYAAYAGLTQQAQRGLIPEGEEALRAAEPAARAWYTRMGAFFLRGYLDTAGGAGFLPSSEEDLRILLDAYLLEKAVYELAYELNNRPDWARIPLRGIDHLLEPPPEAEGAGTGEAAAGASVRW